MAHVSTLLFALIVTAYYFMLYILFMFQRSYSLQSSLLTILFCIYCSCSNSHIRFHRHCLLFYCCIYCSCFNSLIRFNRHCLLFYSVNIVHFSTLLFALIVTAYYFILYILLMFQFSCSLWSSLLTILFCIYCSSFNAFIRFNRHCLLLHSLYIVHVSTLLFALIVTAYYFILYIWLMFQASYSL